MLQSPLSSIRSALLSASLLSLLLACSGGSKESQSSCSGDDCQSCVPLSCGELGAQCGAIDDGCGNTLECGTCKAWEVCGSELANLCNVDCGDGELDPQEECDDGNVVTEFCEYGEDYYCEVCDRFCSKGAGKLQWCGDLTVQADSGEECDDNNDVEWDGCDLQCQKNSCQFEEVFSVTRNDLHGLAISGNTLYMGEDEALTIYDISNGTPLQVGSFSDESGYGFGVATVHLGRLLIPGRGNHLAIYDISDPLSPSLLTSVGAGLGAIAMHVEANRVYLGTYSGFSVVDISNLNAPVVMGSVDFSPDVYSIAASGTTVFVGTTSGVRIYDASNGLAPQLLSTWDPLPDDGFTTNIRGIAIDGNRMYANGGMANLRSVDISDPASPLEIIDNFAVPGSTPGGPALLLGSNRIIASNGAGVFAVERNNGVLTELLGGFAASSVRHMVMKDDLIYITADNTGFFGSNHYLKALRITCE